MDYNLFMRIFLAFIFSIFPALLHAQGIGHDREVEAFIGEMVNAHDFDRNELESLFGKIERVDEVLRLAAAPSPSRRKNWNAYRALFVNRIRIEKGVSYWNQYGKALSRASRQFAVPPEIIVAIIGVETLYGRHTGSFRVMDALSTLAFDYPDAPNRKARMAYFRSELENALVFAKRSGIDPLSLHGSYAGAIGLPQFMPGSIMKYGIDFDGDGRIDLMHSPVDAIGSVANFLAMHGWRKGEGLVFPAKIDSGSGNWRALEGEHAAKFSLKDLEEAGVAPVKPVPDARFGLVDLENGGGPTEYWLGTGNFFAITQYNRSYYYAMSVVDLSREVKRARAFR